MCVTYDECLRIKSTEKRKQTDTSNYIRPLANRVRIYGTIVIRTFGWLYNGVTKMRGRLKH